MSDFWGRLRSGSLSTNSASKEKVEAVAKEVASLQADVQQLKHENRVQAEMIQKLEMEKSLLQNLVNQMWGGEDEDEQHENKISEAKKEKEKEREKSKLSGEVSKESQLQTPQKKPLKEGSVAVAEGEEPIVMTDHLDTTSPPVQSPKAADGPITQAVRSGDEGDQMSNNNKNEAEVVGKEEPEAALSSIPTQKGSVLMKVVMELQETNAQLSVRLDAARQQVAELNDYKKMAERKTRAFDGALSNLNQELKASDEKVNELQEKLKFYEDQAAQLERLMSQVESQNQTIEAMMLRVARADEEKKKTEQDFEAIIAKTSVVAEATVTELSEKTETLTRATDELERVKKELVAVKERIAGMEATIEEQQDSRTDEDRAAIAEATKAQVQEQLKKAAEKHSKSLCDLREAHEEEMAAVAAHHESEKQAALQQLEKELAAVMEKKVAEAKAAADREIEAFKEEIASSTEAATALIASLKDTVEEQKDEIRQLRGQIGVKDGRIDELRAALSKAEASLFDANTTISKLREVEKMLKDATLQLEEAAAAKEAAAAAKATIAELTAKVDDVEGEYKIKLKMNNNLVKSLQQQLAILQKKKGGAFPPAATTMATGERGASNDVLDGQTPPSTPSAEVSNVIEEENATLISRVAALQEQIWSLQTAKETYEVEFKRISEQLEMKEKVIAAHFADAAQRYSQLQGKFGASFFKPSKDEIHRQTHSKLERALEENIQLMDANAKLHGELERVNELLMRAQDEGFLHGGEEEEEEEAGGGHQQDRRQEEDENGDVGAGRRRREEDASALFE